MYSQELLSRRGFAALRIALLVITPFVNRPAPGQENNTEARQVRAGDSIDHARDWRAQSMIPGTRARGGRRQ